MFESIDIIKTLDQIRTSQKVKIQDLVEGIMSRKKYTRLLNDESSISFYDLAKLLAKLSIPFQEFSMHVVNSIEYTNPHESTFYLTIVHNQYQKAYDEVYPKIKADKLKTILGSKAVPATEQLMLYKLGIKSRQDILTTLNCMFDLEEILATKIIDDSIGGILLAYIHVVDDKLKRSIGAYISEVLFDPSYKYYLAFSEVSSTILHMVGILSYTLLDTFDETDKEALTKITLYALNFHAKFRGSIFDHKIFTILYAFQKKMGYSNDAIIFYYISSYISPLEREDLPLKLDVTKKDVEIFKNYLKKDLSNQDKMYEGILSNGKIW